MRVLNAALAVFAWSIVVVAVSTLMADVHSATHGMGGGAAEWALLIGLIVGFPLSGAIAWLATSKDSK